MGTFENQVVLDGDLSLGSGRVVAKEIFRMGVLESRYTLGLRPATSS